MKRSHSTELICKFCGHKFGSWDDRGLQGHQATCPRRRHAQPEPMADIRTDKVSASKEEGEDPADWFVFDGAEADLEESARAHHARMEHERTSKVWHCRSGSCPFYNTRVTPAFGTFDILVCSFCCRPVIEGPVADYILLQSIGAINVDKEAGDGGYSQWMLSHFKEEPTLCVGTCRLEFKGGNEPNYSAMARSFGEQLSQQFRLFPEPSSKVVVLNWHVRITGKPNAWTGRGAVETLPTIRSACQKRGLRLLVVYTVHEKGAVGNYIPDADAIITLNPDVRKAMIELCPGIPVYLSKVPNLLESAPTRSVDLIGGFVGLQPQQQDQGAKLAMAHILRELGDRGQPTLKSYSALKKVADEPGQWMMGKGDKELRGKDKEGKSKKWLLPDMLPAGGLVIFGTITTRHFSMQNITALCRELNDKRVPDHIQVIIAGQAKDNVLKKALETEADTNARLHYHGQIATLNEVTRARYAISFDKDGYRDNASAMVNMIRAGLLLFARRDGEADLTLIARAVNTILQCEANPRFYTEMLAAQHPLYQRLRSTLVGHGLDQIFAELAAGDP